jgi:phosphoesterase RecJ-like protein
MTDDTVGHDGRYAPDELAATWAAMAAGRVILVATHANADADAVASVVAVRLLLGTAARTVVMTTGDGRVPETLRFLTGNEGLLQPTDLREYAFDLIVLVDCADPTRLGPLFEALPGWFGGSIPIVNIDHHVTNTRFGTVNLVDSVAASTTEVLTELALSAGVLVGSDLATCLLAGIYGDTLGLQTSSTTPRTLRLAALLLESGADLPAIVTHLFRRKSFSTVRLWGLALARARLEDGIVWTEVTAEMLEASGASAAEGEGLVNFLSGTDGARLALLFYEQPEGWRVSLRSASDELDVSAIASRFGGGGHSRAAGCRLPPGDEARQTFLEQVARAVIEHVITSDAAG